MGSFFSVYAVPVLAGLVSLTVVVSAGHLVWLEWTAPPEPPPLVIEKTEISPDLPPAAKAAAIKRQLEVLQTELTENKARTDARAARVSRVHSAQVALQISLSLMFVVMALMSVQRARARRAAGLTPS